MQQPSASEKIKFDNPVVEIYKGVKVRKYNKLQIRVNQFEYKRIIDARIDLGLTGRSAIEKVNLFPCIEMVPQKTSYAKSY